MPKAIGEDIDVEAVSAHANQDFAAKEKSKITQKVAPSRDRNPARKRLHNANRHSKLRNPQTGCQFFCPPPVRPSSRCIGKRGWHLRPTRPAGLILPLRRSSRRLSSLDFQGIKIKGRAYKLNWAS